MNKRTKNFVSKWHSLLNLPRQSPPTWYRDRVREELQERRAANTPLHKLSETSDVFFSISRARHDGFPLHRLPTFNFFRNGGIYVYMMLKFTLRWGFYRVAARICQPRGAHDVREVVNPAKDRKLDEVAGRHGLDRGRFRRVGACLRRVWPLLP